MNKRKNVVKAVLLLAGAGMMLPKVAFAAEKGTEAIGNELSLFYCIPFLAMLLCIAICPLVAEHWWEKWRPAIVVLWSLAFLIPFAINKGFGLAWEEALEAIVGDYLGFIVLLFGLFCVAGNISLRGDLLGKPKLNVVLLLIGTLLSSWIGTTGASMVMIRPLIKANKWRKRKVQIVVFFIFLVSNIGGCLTPVGDPPLLMGFTRGVDFFWSMNLLPVFLLNTVLLLAVFYFVDKRALKKDMAERLKEKKIDPENKEKLHLDGAHNIIFLLMIVGAVILSGVLPQQVEFFKGEVHFVGEVALGYAAILEMAIILIAAFLSFKTTKKEVRTSNNFTWGAIQEVAVLFIGIFITMIPALLILKAKGSELGLDQPWQFFWITGILSSFLDNTPTYLVFFTTAASSALKGAPMVATALGNIPKIFLMAISCGAVFMGANTYIGNAPNFMVRSIAEENKIKMPSFFGYMKWSVMYLIPVFLIDMVIFFLFA